MENMLKITSIEELRKNLGGELVELPPFSENQNFVAKLKRPSMLAMVRAGKIPNELLVNANKMFASGINERTFNTLDKDMLKEIFDIMDVFCEESFVEPTYKELKENGIQLTDDQLMFVFNYSQNGVRALSSFRQ